MILQSKGTSAAGVRLKAWLPPWAFSVIAAMAVAIAYFLAARLSLGLLEKPDGVAVFWPAAGVASGILIVARSRARWSVILGVMAGTIPANLMGDRDIWSAISFGIANASEAVIVAGLIERTYGPLFELNTLRRVLGLFAAAIVASAFSGIFGTLGFIWFHGDAPGSVSTVWLHWFVADSLGTITVAPLVIGAASLMRNPPSKREAAEGALALALLCVLCVFLVFLPHRYWTGELAVITLGPWFVWMAARLPPGITSAATFICSITIVATTTFSIGIFGDSHMSFEERTQSAQASILAIAFGALVLTALFSERRLQGIAILDREARLQEALTAGRVMAFDWDIHSDQVRHSQNAAAILGLRSKDVLSAREMLEQVHPHDRALLIGGVCGVSRDEPSYSTTFRYQRAEGGNELWLEQVATVQFDSEALPVRIRGLTTDITQRKQFEEEISRAQKMAERADRTKSIFLAAVSHDLRQPLQTLRLLLGALEPAVRDEEERNTIVGMGRSIDTMSGMLSSLLDINRLETGNLSTSMSDFAVNALFDSVATDLIGPLEEKRLLWRVVPSDLVVHSDKRMLEQMIRNLLSNAIRYTDRGKILMGCRRAGEKIRIEVWDTGIGIPGDQLPHIFEEYYCHAERGGFGIGLAIVKRLGEILDHRVEVRSTPGKGTTVSIEVPRGRAAVVASESVPMPESEAAPFRSTVLVIEDESSLRSALTRMLSLRDFRVIAASTVSEGRALIERKGLVPDVVLCDYNLQGPMNGIECIESLRATLAWNIPAIMMTGDTRLQTREAIASHGYSLLIKPFLCEELMQLINELSRSPEPSHHNLSAGRVRHIDNRPQV